MCNDLPTLRVNEIGEFIRHNSCPRRFKLEVDGRREARRLPFHERLFGALDPVLQEEGRRREDQWERMLIDAGYIQLKPAHRQPFEWESFSIQLENLRLGQNVFAREVSVSGNIGRFAINGRIDFIIITWEDGYPVLRIVECKSSRRDRTYHRIQVAIYRLLIKDHLDHSPLSIEGVRLDREQVCAFVARVDETTNTPQAILELAALDLDLEEADIARLTDDNGPLKRICRSDLNDLPYQLEAKCDGCIFSTDCLPESGLHRKLELIGLSPASVRSLRRAGVATIDDLAEIDENGAIARRLQADATFSENLAALILKARTRRLNLPVLGEEPRGFEVESIPNSGRGTLPEYEIDGTRLIRVYLCVDYDYAENRIGALTAHVTTSQNLIYTPFESIDGNWRPHPHVKELGPDQDSATPIDELHEISGREVFQFVNSPWSGDYVRDNGAESLLIENFLNDLTDAMDEIAAEDDAPVHFYIWSPSEMRRLVEGCSRADSRLLGHLRHLMGCRESLEQLIFSCVGTEVNRRYALAWTGRALTVATSLRWFGKRYHWSRSIGRQSVALDSVFTQDLFDFKTTLDVLDNGAWGRRDEGTKQLFEIRGRFYDSLPAPYWRAQWGTLPHPDEVDDRRLSRMIERYNRAGRPNYIRGYLRARVHALRWVEERILKNNEIEKPSLNIPALRDFRLDADTVADACVEFLRLDQHVEMAEWLSSHLQPPSVRVSSFASIPIRNARQQRRSLTVTAQLEYDEYGIDPAEASTNCSLGEGSFVRISPRPDDIHEGQSVGLLQRYSSTCVVDELNWVTGEVVLSIIPTPNANRYCLQSLHTIDEDMFEHAVIDESPSDYIAPKVDTALGGDNGTHVFRWFDPTAPIIPEATPIDAERRAELHELISTFQTDDGKRLNDNQVQSILDGIEATVQLLQGPPGTGKTLTLAVNLLIRLLAIHIQGDIILITGPTHTAVDTLLSRVNEVKNSFEEHARQHGFIFPVITIGKVHSSQITPSPDGIEDFIPGVRPFKQAVDRGILVLGGTTSAILKTAKKLRDSRTFPREDDGTFVASLFVDEASMLLFPHFLGLATLVKRDGNMVVAGDHRQLSPIISHDWEHEDRPTTVMYQPYVSAFEAVLRLASAPRITSHSIVRTGLDHTYRLPPEVRVLICRIYAQDNIELLGDNGDTAGAEGEIASPLDHLWTQQTGLFLIVHDEDESRKSNELEAQIIGQILDADHATQDAGSVAVITPHRAQRVLLERELGERPVVGMIDTVERLQGGECPTVIVSATASDPAAIGANVEFLLNLNRSNVAFSRAQNRLIVVCGRTLLDHVPPELEHYQSAELWKSLRQMCTEQLDSIELNSHTVDIFMCPRNAVEACDA